jgi:L-cysteine:1D-myo-inositol 2-amino-2-deoxy-alpha-D-glucopyranoside ligase
MQLYNSLTQTKETFTPLADKKVTMYVCGITPYDTTHLGHAFTYVAFDTLVRYLLFQKYNVNYTQNVTDINDRDNDMLKRAQEKHMTWQELSTYWTQQFLDDMEKLNWIKPTNYLYASKEIGNMIELIKKILNNTAGYVVNGGVYLDIEHAHDFGKLSKLNKEQMLSKAKEFEEDLDNPDKKHPLDITLWKPAKDDQPSHIPSFASPWGKGRPGWHIECSTMSISSLGEQIDIHGGGIDLIFPHHESEIAQSESATQKEPFAKYWIHTGTVSINGQKMSKSLGNLLLVKELLKKSSPNAIRWVLLSHHYRDNWQYNEKELENAEKSIDVVKHALSQKFTDATNQTSLLRDGVLAYMDDDLNTPEVLNLFEQAAKTVEISKNLPLQSQLRELYTMLGFTL